MRGTQVGSRVQYQATPPAQLHFARFALDGQRRSALGTTCSREALRLRQIEPDCPFFPCKPRELIGWDTDVRGMCVSGRLAATRTVTLDKAEKRLRDLVGYRSVQNQLPTSTGFMRRDLAMRHRMTKRHPRIDRDELAQRL